MKSFRRVRVYKGIWGVLGCSILMLGSGFFGACASLGLRVPPALESLSKDLTRAQQRATGAQETIKSPDESKDNLKNL